ncbi:TetR/AcrR family transcriptional regulator [Cohnella sp. JJ-181]|uniref:TetR/AcrR family transcriptional regulator n=1 Tax=Cohnella rhizoplanae TaxID=2974897 RepID=UPI00232DE13E|nr:TetR/AcrR family transcriptional regulator [Cohnella sp. JJ-181]
MENRRTQIINLAAALIRKKGYSSFTYDEISKHFGVTKASIHYHFEKKEDLGLAVLNQLYHELLSLKSELRQSSKSVEEKLHQYRVDRSSHFAEYDLCPISSLQSDYEVLPESMRQKLKEINELELSIVADIVSEGITDPSVNVRALAITILAAMKGTRLYNRGMQADFFPDILYGLTRLLKN